MLYCCASEQTKWNHVSTAGVVFVPSPKLVQKGFTRIWFNSFCQDSFLVRRIVSFITYAMFPGASVVICQANLVSWLLISYSI